MSPGPVAAVRPPPPPPLPSSPPALRLHTLDLTGILLPPAAPASQRSADAPSSSPAAPLARTLTEEERRLVRLALTTHGALQVRLPERRRPAIAAAHDAARRLFRQPPAVKRSFPVISPGGFTRGYVPDGSESGSAARELKEGFSFGYDWPGGGDGRQPRNSLQGPNAWPDVPGGDAFRRDALAAYDVLCEVSVALVAAVADAFFEDSRADFVERFASDEGKTISLARMFRYFQDDGAGPGEDPGVERTGSAQHSDWGFLTLVSEGPSTGEAPGGGLQIFVRDPESPSAPGDWRSVRPDPGCLVVHAGDYLSLLSGGTIISPVHRVVPPFAPHAAAGAAAERFSLVFFWYPAYDATFPPVPGALLERKLSLLADQREGCPARTAASAERDEALRTAEKLRTLSFGEFICEKWGQVFRAG